MEHQNQPENIHLHDPASQTALDLYNQGLEEMPEIVWKATRLQVLNLGSNKLTHLPDSFGSLKHLRMLDIGHNRLQAIPQSIGTLKQLRFLYLSDNGFESVPDSLGRLKELRYLNLTDNRLTSLPAALGKLTNLIELRLYNNQIEALPGSLGRLQNLKELYVMNNRLTSLPRSIGNLKQQRKIMLENNLIVPRVMARAVGVNPVASLLAFIAFGTIFGFVGALLAIPLAAVVQLILNRLVFNINTSDASPPSGRDALSSLRYEAQGLAQDVRKQVRHKEDELNETSDQVEDAMEAVIQDLDSILAQAEQMRDKRQQGRRAGDKLP